MRQYRSDILDFFERCKNHLYRFDYNDLKILLNTYLPSIPISIVDFSNAPFFFRNAGQDNYGMMNVVFRARLIENTQHTPYEYVSEISYIKESEKHKIKGFGRANKPSEPMFYGSLNFATACTEAIIKRECIREKQFCHAHCWCLEI